MLGFLKARPFGIQGRTLFSATIINAGTLSWYMYFANYNGSDILFKNFTTNSSLINIGAALFFLTAGISAFVGVLLRKKISNKRFLWAWTLFGILCTAMTLFFKGDIFIFIFGPLLGIGMGLAFPYSLSLLASHTEIEQRGRAAGIMLFETFAFVALAGFVSDQFNLGIIGAVSALIILKGTTFLGLAIGKISSNANATDQLPSKPRFSIRETNKTFLMYLVPWILFIIAIVLTDHIVWASLGRDPQIYNALHGPPYAYVGTAIFAVVTGFLADRIGRKIPIIIGLALLGFSFVLLNSAVTPETVFIHRMAIGIAFGFLITAYVVIPGDLAEKFDRERLYALTVVLPLLIYFGVGALPQYFGASATATSVSWILTSLIFASIIPVYLAKETLKEEKIRERETKEYLKKLIKVVEESKGTEE